jgi:hypothetical protein
MRGNRMHFEHWESSKQKNVFVGSDVDLKRGWEKEMGDLHSPHEGQ